MTDKELKKRKDRRDATIGTIIVIILVLLLRIFGIQTVTYSVGFSGEEHTDVNYGEVFDPDSISIYVNEEEISAKPVVELSELNYNKLGSYSIVVKYIDENKNVIYEEERFINIKDLTPPEIILKGSNPITIMEGSVYEDAGYVVKDNYDKPENIKIEKSGTVDTSKPGVYTITYTATDTSGNSSKITRTIIVEKAGVTIMQLIGTQTVYVEFPNDYIEEGCIALDTVDGNISSKIKIEGTIDTSELGTYIITYLVTNSSGKTSKTQRTVVVRDTTKPIITISGENPIYHEAKTPYIDLGAAVTDNYDDIIVAKINSTVNENVKGTYHVTYTAIDSNGNMAQETRTVIVQDTTAPVISVANGTVDIEWYSTIHDVDSFIRNGVTALDNYDGDLTSGIVYKCEPEFNATIKGIYIVTYSVKDNSNNSAVQKIKIINVQETLAPVGIESYSTTNPTNQDITVTIITDKPCDTPVGWVKLDDTTFTKIYDNNISEVVTITAINGLSSTVNINITNIDKIPPDSFTPGVVTTTLDSITINGETEDKGGSGIAYYYFSNDDGATWIGPQTFGTYTFTGLAQGTIYNIRQKAVDHAGNETISELLTIRTKKVVSLTFYVPVVYEDTRIGNEWNNRNHILGLYNTTQTSNYTYSELSSISGSSFIRYAYYEMRGIGVNNSYNSSGEAIEIPTNATIVSGRLHSRFGARNDHIIQSLTATITVSGTGISISSGTLNLGTNSGNVWTSNIIGNFVTLPTRNSDLGLSLMGNLSSGGITGSGRRTMCAYIYGEFVAQWEE